MTGEISNTVWFFVGVCILSIGISYAWWMKIRVLWLRQDIYDLRDRIFMKAAELGCAQDEAAQYARTHLNSLARIASVISVPFVLTAVKEGLVEIREMPKSSNARLNKMIKSAMQCADARVARYLMRETAFGWLLVIASRIVLMKWLLQAVTSSVKEWMESDAAEGAVRIMEEERRHGRWLPAQ